MKESKEQIGCGSVFAVHIRYFQNSTWQGEIVWKNKNKTQYFRSELELLALMEEAIKSDIPDAND